MVCSCISTTLWLVLVLIVRSGYGQTIDGAVTLRWHSNYHKQYPPATPHPQFPVNVCRYSVAICLDIKLNECVRSPAEFLYPYNFHVKDGNVQHETDDVPGEHGGGYLLLAESDLNDSTGTMLTLWNNCTEGCKSCSESTGIANRPVQTNICGVTQEQNVYSIISPTTSMNCVSSLSTYYEHININGFGINLLDPNGFWTISPIVVVCGIITIILVICAWIRRHRRADDVNLVDPSKAITKSKIDQFFPSLPMTTTCDEPTCVVCLSTIAIEQEYRKLQCSHYFHTECIDSWWLYKPRVELECPLCKRTQNLEEQQETSAGPQPEVLGHTISPSAEAEVELIAV